MCAQKFCICRGRIIEKAGAEVLTGVNNMANEFKRPLQAWGGSRGHTGGEGRWMRTPTERTCLVPVFRECLTFSHLCTLAGHNPVDLDACLLSSRDFSCGNFMQFLKSNLMPPSPQRFPNPSSYNLYHLKTLVTLYATPNVN